MRNTPDTIGPDQQTMHTKGREAMRVLTVEDDMAIATGLSATLTVTGHLHRGVHTHLAGEGIAGFVSVKPPPKDDPAKNLTEETPEAARQHPQPQAGKGIWK